MKRRISKFKNMLGIESSQEDWHEFHPTALSIERAPTAPAGRMVFWVILALLLVIALVMYFGKVDVTVSATGQVLPVSHVQVIQPLETGILRTINAEVGKRVKKGEVLFEIEPDLNEFALEASEGQQASYLLEVQRLQALLNGTGFLPNCQGQCPDDVIMQQRVLFNNTQNAYNSRLASYDAQIDSLRQRTKTTQLRKTEAREKLALVESELARLRPVEDLIAKNEIAQLEQRQVEERSRVNQLESEAGELAYQLHQVEEQKIEYANGFRNELSQQLVEARRQLMGIEASQEQNAYRKEKQFLRAPADGIITQLNAHTVGGVVTPSEVLLQMVDDDNPLQVQVLINNRDIGLLRPGLPVKIKVDAYDYQKYGMLKGKLRYLSHNINLPDKNPNNADKEQKAAPFTAYVDLNKETIMVEGQPKQLSPGMSVRAEVMVGKRRLYEFFLYPLIKAGREAFTVR